MQQFKRQTPRRVMRTLKPGLLVLTLLCFNSQALAAAPKKITVAYASVGPSMSGVWMAKEIGAFEKYGLQADLIYISSGPIAIASLIGGDLDVAVGASNAVIAAVLRGALLVALASTANRPSHMLWVQPEINRLEDLRGKTLGVTRFGSITHNLSVLLLRRHGLEGGVNVRQLGGTPEVGAAFQQRAIAGAVTSTLRVEAHVPAKMLMNLADSGIPYSMNMITVWRDYHRRYPETVEGVVRAYVEGVAALHQQKERALKVLAQYSRLKDSKMLEEMYQHSVNYLDRIPRVELEAVSTILEFMGKKAVPLETFADNSIVDRLVRDGFIDKLYKKR